MTYGKWGGLAGSGPSTIPKNRVSVNNDDDLPPLTGSYSELAADTQYFFQNNITITKPIRISGVGTSLLGTGPFSSGITYNGALPCITVNNVSTVVHELSINTSTASQVIDATGTGTNTFYSNALNIEGSSKLGTFNGISPVIRDFVAVGFSDGFTFSSAASTIRGVSFVNAFMVDDLTGNAVHFDLADAVCNDFELLAVLMDGVGTCVFSSVGGQANLVANLEADVANCTFGSGFMTPLSGFTSGFQTNQWSFRDNSPLNLVEDSKYEADFFLLSQNVVTVTTQNVFYEIGTPLVGSWSSDIQNHFILNADGSLTYIGDKDISCKFLSTVTLEKVGGGSDKIEGRLAINWTAGQTGVAKSQSSTMNSQPTSITISAAIDLSPNDNIRLIFANTNSTSDINILTCQANIAGK